VPAPDLDKPAVAVIALEIVSAAGLRIAAVFAPKASVTLEPLIPELPLKAIILGVVRVSVAEASVIEPPEARIRELIV